MQYALLALLIFWVIYKLKNHPSNAPKASDEHMSQEMARDILGVEEGATKDEIDAAYKDLIKKIHPDAGGSERLTQLTIQAKKVLSDE